MVPGTSRGRGLQSVAIIGRWAIWAGLAWAAALAPAQRPEAREPQTAAIRPGSFDMGSAQGAAWERPVHQVRTRAFAIAVRPVTNAEYRAFRPYHKSWGSDVNSAPVTGVSWYDAQAYCAWLSTETGKPYQLPLESWWERAARGGLRQRPYPWGDQPVAVSSSEPEAAPLPPPNDFGVYAAGFNLWEWTADWYASDYYANSPAANPTGPIDGVFRVLRGGGYRGEPASATTYTRGSARPATRSELITFRVARPLAANAPELNRPQPTVSRAVRPASPSSPLPADSAEVSAITVEEEAGELVVRVSTGKPVRFETVELTDPNRLVVDLLASINRTGRQLGNIEVDKIGVERVRYSQFQESPPIFRLVVDHTGTIDYQLEVWDKAVLLRLRPKAPSGP